MGNTRTPGTNTTDTTVPQNAPSQSCICHSAMSQRGITNAPEAAINRHPARSRHSSRARLATGSPSRAIALRCADVVRGRIHCAHARRIGREVRSDGGMDRRRQCRREDDGSTQDDHSLEKLTCCCPSATHRPTTPKLPTPNVVVHARRFWRGFVRESRI